CSFCVSMSTSSTFTLSLPDALPILSTRFEVVGAFGEVVPPYLHLGPPGEFAGGRPRHRAAGAIALQVHHLGQHADVGAGAEPVPATGLVHAHLARQDHLGQRGVHHIVEHHHAAVGEEEPVHRRPAVAAPHVHLTRHAAVVRSTDETHGGRPRGTAQ